MRALLFLALAASAARAHPVDTNEHLFGAASGVATTGHGRLTALVSGTGELIVLRWPSPSYYEHVNYKAAAGDNPRALPLFGAKPNEGSFAGLWTAPGGFTWLRDAPWKHTVRYASDDSTVIVTTYRNDALGITVTGRDAIDPARDALVRRYEVAPDSATEYATLRLVYYENFAPTLEKDPFYANDQFDADLRRDYALLYVQDQQALLHFSLPGRPAARLLSLELDGLTETGMFLAVRGSRIASGWQCGRDSVDGAGGAGPTDAFSDAFDGTLSLSELATQHATGALAFDLPASGGAVDVTIGVGATASAALQATSDGAFADVAARSDARTAAIAARVRLPPGADTDQIRFSKRTFLAIDTGTDRETGAIVASVASHPPYNLDWPRDGSFFNYALDVAGFHDEVSRHNAFYARVQRRVVNQDVDALFGPAFGDVPAGSFAMNYYADGVPGAPIPFEIDQVGFVLWSWCEHAKWIAPDAARAELESLWPNIVLAAGVLVDCKDATGLQCPANEDDNFRKTQTLHGAITAWLGLGSAVRAARFLGRTAEADRWRERMLELGLAIDTQMGHPDVGWVGRPGGAAGETGDIAGVLSWLVWPAKFVSAADPRMARVAGQIAGVMRPFFEKRDGGGQYHAKSTTALAWFYSQQGDAAGLATVKTWTDLLLKEVALPTGHLGEVYVHEDLDGDGDKEYQNRVGVPHLWEATLVYLSLMAARDAAAFERPELAELDPPAPDEESCGCGGGADVVWPALLALIGLKRRWSTTK